MTSTASHSPKCQQANGTYACDLPTGHTGEHKVTVSRPATNWNPTQIRKTLVWGGPRGDRWIAAR